MKLGANFREALLAGRQPALTDEPDLRPSQRITILSGQVWITVGRVDKEGCWSYLLRDDRPHLLAKGSGYTNFHGRAIGASDRHLPGNLWDEPEAIDSTQHDRLHAEAGAKLARDQGLQRARAEVIRLERQMQDRLRRGRIGQAKILRTRRDRLVDGLKAAA